MLRFDAWVVIFKAYYYRDELKAKGLNPDFKSIQDDHTQRQIQNIIMTKVHVNKLFRFNNTSSNDDKSIIKPGMKNGKMILNFGYWNILLSDQDNSKLMKILWSVLNMYRAKC